MAPSVPAMDLQTDGFAKFANEIFHQHQVKQGLCAHQKQFSVYELPFSTIWDSVCEEGGGGVREGDGAPRVFTLQG